MRSNEIWFGFLMFLCGVLFSLILVTYIVSPIISDLEADVMYYRVKFERCEQLNDTINELQDTIF